MSNNGMFITLEGIEGAGKSTHVPFIVDQLKNANHEVIATREPGGTKLGESIRNTLLTNENISIDGDAELLLMFAARAQHLHDVIRPALTAGKTVVCDRFTDSSFAYQAGGRGIDNDKINQLVQLVHADLKPDLTLLFDLPVELGLERANKRDMLDRFESEDMKFFRSVRDTYLKIASAEPDRVKIIDAADDIETVQSAIADILKQEARC